MDKYLEEDILQDRAIRENEIKLEINKDRFTKDGWKAYQYFIKHENDIDCQQDFRIVNSL